MEGVEDDGILVGVRDGVPVGDTEGSVEGTAEGAGDGSPHSGVVPKVALCTELRQLA